VPAVLSLGRPRLLAGLLIALALLALAAVASHAAGADVALPGRSAADARAAASVAGAVRKPPIRRVVRQWASVRKRKPTGRVLPPRPGVVRKRAPRPVRPAGKEAPNIAATPNDPLWAASWSLAKVNATEAWKVSTGTAQTIVAVLDTGVDLSHPDLQGAFVPGYDFVNRDEDASDDHGHGTMVAGIIAARANNGIGGVGICSHCSIMPVKVIAANGSGDAANVAEGIMWAVDHGARVLNLSFVLSGPDDGVARAIEYARARGLVVVAAAGNAGSSEMTFPAGLPGVVGVTGTDAADSRYSWASFGSWVRVAAPGCSQSTASGGGYGDFCGTSSAAAFVSGLAGLARSLPAGASLESVEHALVANAAPVGDIAAAGRVDARGVLDALRAIPLPPEAVTAPEPAAADFS
jgi:subtilisin family serine protease